MTIIAACKAKVNNKTVVYAASDGQFTRGGEALRVKDCCKIVKFPNFVAMFTGIASVHHILQEMAHDEDFLRQDCCKMENPLHALAFARVVGMELGDRLSDAPEKSWADMIIATPESIYVSDSYQYVHEVDDFTAQGSGGPYTLGYLEGVYEDAKSENDLEKMMYKGLKIACAIDTGCGGDLFCIKVTKENLPEGPKQKVVKKRKKVKKNATTSNPKLPDHN